MAAQRGACIIGNARFDDYQLAALRAMGADVAKIQVHDVDIAQHWGAWWDAGMLDRLASLLPAGGTIIIRTAETRITPDDLRFLLAAPLRGGGISLADWIAHQPRRVVLEVGNEPDLAGVDCWEHRYWLLQAVPTLRASAPRAELCASLATHRGNDTAPGARYNEVLLSDGALARAYDSLGVHGYGYHSFSRDEGEAWAVHDQAAATGKPLWWTEAGIAHAAPWPERCAEYARFAGALGDQVRGVTFFALDTSPQWYEDQPPHVSYALDVGTDGAVDLSFAGSRALRAPLASGIAAPAPASPPAPPARAAISARTPLLGAIDLQVTDVARALGRPGGAYTPAQVGEIATAIVDFARRFGLRPSLLAAQIALETGWLRFGGQIPAENFNLAGFGATTHPDRFPTPRRGVLAVAVHLLAYRYGRVSAWPEDLRQFAWADPRLALVTENPARAGMVQTVQDFNKNGSWCFVSGIPEGQSNGYGDKIIQIANIILGRG